MDQRIRKQIINTETEATAIMLQSIKKRETEDTREQKTKAKKTLR